MLLLQLGVLTLKRLKLGDLARGSPWWCFRSFPSDQSVAHVLPPLGQHERMDLQHSGDGLHLNPRLLTQSHRGQLELVTVLAYRAWPKS